MYPRNCHAKLSIISIAHVAPFWEKNCRNFPCPMGHLGKEQSNDRVSVLDRGSMYSM